ncbi:MAG: DUF2203 family protein [Planctomycetaceae bacterium]|jgi:hypothetical protein|nr:DUF2203 family protein [Planctomycetaceae bacterium]
MGKTEPLTQVTVTYRQARAMLPLVRSIVSDAKDLERQLQQRRHDLSRVRSGGPKKAGRLYDDELAESRNDLEADERQLDAYRNELTQLGLRWVSSDEGEVEFPTTFANRTMYLCWKLGDDDLVYWRQPEQSFDLRERIPDQALATLSSAARF